MKAGSPFAGLATAIAMAVMAGPGLYADKLVVDRSPPVRFDRKPPPIYDGLGRKRKRKAPLRAAKRWDTAAFRDFARRVRSTHSDKPDPRDDKYLHSHARAVRGLKRTLARAA